MLLLSLHRTFSPIDAEEGDDNDHEKPNEEREEGEPGNFDEEDDDESDDDVKVNIAFDLLHLYLNYKLTFILLLLFVIRSQ